MTNKMLPQFAIAAAGAALAMVSAAAPAQAASLVFLQQVGNRYDYTWDFRGGSGYFRDGGTFNLTGLSEVTGISSSGFFSADQLGYAVNNGFTSTSASWRLTGKNIGFNTSLTPDFWKHSIVFSVFSDRMPGVATFEISQMGTTNSGSVLGPVRAGATPVPEPGTVAGLTGIAMFGLARLALKKRNCSPQ